MTWVSVYSFTRAESPDGETRPSLDDAIERAYGEIIHDLVGNRHVDYIKERNPPRQMLWYRGKRDADLLEDVPDEYAFNFNAVSEYAPDESGYIIEVPAHVRPGDTYFPTQ